MNKEETLDFFNDVIDNKVESYSFFPIRFVCYLIALPSLFLVLSGNISAFVIGFILLALTLPIAVLQQRLTVDLTNNRYRAYSSFFGIKIGKWQSFKGFKIITITHSDRAIKMNVAYGGAESYGNSTEFHLNLKKDNYNKLNIASGTYKSVFKKAVVLAHRYKVGIMDCSEKPNKKYTYEEIEAKYPDKAI